MAYAVVFCPHMGEFYLAHQVEEGGWVYLQNIGLSAMTAIERTEVLEMLWGEGDTSLVKLSSIHNIMMWELNEALYYPLSDDEEEEVVGWWYRAFDPTNPADVKELKVLVREVEEGRCFNREETRAMCEEVRVFEMTKEALAVFGRLIW